MTVGVGGHVTFSMSGTEDRMSSPRKPLYRGGKSLRVAVGAMRAYPAKAGNDGNVCGKSPGKWRAPSVAPPLVFGGIFPEGPLVRFVSRTPERGRGWSEPGGIATWLVVIYLELFQAHSTQWVAGWRKEKCMCFLLRARAVVFREGFCLSS